MAFPEQADKIREMLAKNGVVTLGAENKILLLVGESTLNDDVQIHSRG
uniref:Uncharacterized protein n=1 Tax=Anguilla anguilla TaxID=7936 RepID=A0A0E9RQW7_ANGAN